MCFILVLIRGTFFCFVFHFIFLHASNIFASFLIRTRYAETTILSEKSFGCINQKPYRGGFEFYLLIDTITYENENIGFNFTLGIK